LAKPQAWQMDAANYPFHTVIPTRISDLDLLGHVNNVAFAALFETGRSLFQMNASKGTAIPISRSLVAAVTINYLAEAHFPAPMVLHSGFGGIGTSSLTILTAAFQNDVCCATCETVLVLHADGARYVFTEKDKADLAPHFVTRPVA